MGYQDTLRPAEVKRRAINAVTIDEHRRSRAGYQDTREPAEVKRCAINATDIDEHRRSRAGCQETRGPAEVERCTINAIAVLYNNCFSLGVLTSFATIAENTL